MKITANISYIFIFSLLLSYVIQHKTLLEELYVLEPSLREKEDSIIRIITEMQKISHLLLSMKILKEHLKIKSCMNSLENLKRPLGILYFLLYPEFDLQYLDFSFYRIYFLKYLKNSNHTTKIYFESFISSDYFSSKGKCFWKKYYSYSRKYFPK